MKKVPRQVKNILVEDEAVEHQFDLKGQELYATSKRLIVVKGRSIRDFDYAHISSVAYDSKRYRWLIILGIVIAIIGMSIGEGVAIAAGAIIGFILILIGIMAKSEHVELSIVGVPQPEKFEGERDDLDSLLQLVRQRRYEQKGDKAA